MKSSMRGIQVVVAILFAMAAGCGGTGKNKIDSDVGDAAGDGTVDTAGDNIPDDTGEKDVAPDTVPEIGTDVTDTSPDIADPDSSTPSNCCEPLTGCPNELQCIVWSDDSEEPGVCLPPLIQGQCYLDKHCDEGFVCQGGSFCPCNELCTKPIGPGTCIPTFPECCSVDEECPPEHICVAAELGGGTCLLIPDAGKCYYDSNCLDWEVCSGAMLCSCFMDCMSEPGQCLAVPEYCCKDDSDCSPDEVCIDFDAAGNLLDMGACHPAPEQGKCYSDADCNAGETCISPGICPCGFDCLWMGPGICKTDIPPGCCKTSSECPNGTFCLVIDNDKPGSCEPILNFGECFGDEDCFTMSQKCTGATFCPCGELCFAPTTPGSCTPLPQGCCYNDSDCPEDTLCKGQQVLDNLPGQCVTDFSKVVGCPPPGGCCWDDADCPDGKKCEGASLCGCIQLCPVCDCMPDTYGNCK